MKIWDKRDFTKRGIFSKNNENMKHKLVIKAAEGNTNTEREFLAAAGCVLHVTKLKQSPAFCICLHCRRLQNRIDFFQPKDLGMAKIS